MLYKGLLLLCIVGLSVAATSKRDCVVDGHRYKDGQRFTQGCVGSCGCSNGQVACVSLCPPTGFPPSQKCHMVKKVENDCCGHGECQREMANKKCDHNAAPGYNSVTAPWTVKISSGTGSNAKRCMGTIMDENSIFVHENCIGQNDKITFLSPPQTGSKRWAVKQRKQVPFVPHIKELVLEEDIAYQPSVHEVNRPWSHFCDDHQCQLFLTSSKPGSHQNETEFVLAKKAEKARCNIGNNEPQIECLEILEASRPSCTNFDGSEVLVRIHDTYYVVGFLESLSPKNNRGCDNNRERYRKYINTCNRMNIENQ